MLAYRVSCPEAAQDICQETFIRYTGYQEKNTFDNPRAFIFRIAANLATDYWLALLYSPLFDRKQQ
jgi:RNA polymerase sigma-70 factor (ECF subfamily)